MIGCNVTVILISFLNVMNDSFAQEGDDHLPTMIFIQSAHLLFMVLRTF